MTERLPDNIAIIVLGPAGATLGRRLQASLPGSRVHGPSAHLADWDESYERASPHIAAMFEAGRPILGLCASGILIRAVAPLLNAKWTEPSVVAVAEDGSVAVPLVGGHHGANALARAAAELTGGLAAITTAGDLRLGFALDEPPPGWRIANPEQVGPITAALLRREPVALVAEMGGADWLRAGMIDWAEQAERRVSMTDRNVDPGTDALVFHPPVLALGIGRERGCSVEELADLAHGTLAAMELAAPSVAAVVSVELKLAEPGIHALAASLDVPARFFPAPHSPLPGPAVCSSYPSANRGGRPAWYARCGPDRCRWDRTSQRDARRDRYRPRRPGLADPRGECCIGASQRCCRLRAQPRSARPRDRRRAPPRKRSRRRGGKGVPSARSRRQRAVGGARLLGRRRHLWARLAGLRAARSRGKTGMANRRDPSVSRRLGGAGRCRPGGRAAWPRFLRDIALRSDDPLGDDPHTPRSRSGVRFRRDTLHPRSSRRPARLTQAVEILLRHRPPQTPVFLGRNLERAGEEGHILTLSELESAEIDMLTVVIVGSSTTRRLDSDPPRLYTPRGYLDDPGGTGPRAQRRT